MKSVFRLPALILATAALLACSEVQENSYKTHAEARLSGAVARGWIPEWVPEQAVEITEAHDLDTNAKMLAFNFPKNLPIALPATCKQSGISRLPAPPFKRRWWPSDVPPNGLSTHRHTFYQCGNQHVAISQVLGEGFSWQPK